MNKCKKNYECRYPKIHKNLIIFFAKTLDNVYFVCYNKSNDKTSEVQQMKNYLLNTYEKYSVADAYEIGFIYEGAIYIIMLNTLPYDCLKVEKASKKNGGWQKLQLRLNNTHKAQFIQQGASRIGGVEMVSGQYNKGVEFERLCYRLHDQEWRGKDNVPFYADGDITVDGKKIQIKFENAQIITECTAIRLNGVGA